MAHERRSETPQLVLAMVGLPARGKSYMAHRLRRYLGWLGYRTRVFNVGSYRRAKLGVRHRESYFSPHNTAAQRQREALADLALADLLDWLRSGGEVGIYDATNTTQARRARVRERVEAAGIRLLFIESICNDPGLVEANIRETKLKSPDYVDMDPEIALADFRARVAHYASVYETVQSGEGSFVKVIDVGRRLEAEQVRGYLPGKVLFFLANGHAGQRPILLTRHGESLFNLEDRVGGDPGLSPRGERYATAVAAFVRRRFGPGADIAVLSSTMRRTIETTALFEVTPQRWRALDEIDAGICDGKTYAEIAAALPQEYAARQADKFHYRYPGGESYRDVIGRVEPVLLEIERQRRPVVVVAHQAIIRVLYSYFQELPAEECAWIRIPLHTVIELRPVATGLEEERHVLTVDP